MTGADHLSDVMKPGTSAYVEAAAENPRWPGYAAVWRLFDGIRQAGASFPVETTALVWRAVEAFADEQTVSARPPEPDRSNSNPLDYLPRNAQRAISAVLHAGLEHRDPAVRAAREALYDAVTYWPEDEQP